MALNFTSIQHMIRYLEEKAIEHASRIGVSLDGTIDSIRSVENILSQLHTEYLDSHSTAGMFGFAMFYGAYVGEVIRRNLWADAGWDGDFSGRAFPSLTRSSRKGQETRIFPASWCYSRITDGPENDIWFKYQMCVVRDEDVIRKTREIKTPGK